MADFLQSLRAANIFNPQGGGGNLLGPPNFNSGMGDGPDPMGIIGTIMQLREQAKQADENRQYRMMEYQHNQALRDHNLQLKERQGFANAGLKPDGTPMDTRVIFPDDDLNKRQRMTDYQAAQIELQKAGLQQKANQFATTAQDKDEDRAIKQQRADVYDRIHDMTDAEKQQFIARARSGDIQAKAALDMALEHERQTGRKELADINNNFRMDLEDKRQSGALDQIAARTAGNITVQGMKNSSAEKTLLPTQQRVDASNRAREFVNKNPEYAGMVTFDSSGNPTIAPPAGNDLNSLATHQRIYDAIYGTPRDIQLPVSTPVTPTPVVNDKTTKNSSGTKTTTNTKKSKYSYTVE